MDAEDEDDPYCGPWWTLNDYDLELHIREIQVREHFDVMCLMQKLKLPMRDFDQLLFFLHHQHSYFIPHYLKYTHHSSECANEFKDILYSEFKADDRRDIVNAGPFSANFDVYTDVNGFQVLGMHIFYWGPDDKIVSKFISMCRLDDGETAEQLLKHYLEMLQKWNIQPEFLVHASLDNAEVNMGVHKGFAKLLNDIGYYVHITPCACHTFFFS
ncbi:hypothetical protein FACS189472_19010 [Alphaproteobacteria bacterium]|nr:hypothetical protein FACS189472_19010 [Alphaproteobacteria bacterium]